MKTYKNIIISVDKHLGLLTINRPDENNSLNIETSWEIYEGLKELEIDSSVRVILILGNQKFFSPGADIKELNNLKVESARSKGLFEYIKLYDTAPKNCGVERQKRANMVKGPRSF